LDPQVRRQRPAALREGEQSGRSRLLNEKHLLGNQRLLQQICEGRTLAAWNERAYGIDLGVRQCQRMFGSWVFGYASLVLQVGKPIRNGRRRKKKLQGLLEDARGLPLGH